MASFFSTLGVILLTMIMFGILITIHEFGHYIVARLFNVGIIEFSIGMGPKIFSWKGKKNDFSIRVLPIGGYVNMVGEYGEEETDFDGSEEKSDENRDGGKEEKSEKKEFAETSEVLSEGNGDTEEKASFSKKPIWQRLLVVLAGPAMNIFLGFLIMFAIVLAGAVKTEGNASSIASLKIADYNVSPSVGYNTSGNNMLYVTMTGNTDEKGFLEGDVIVSADDTAFFADGLTVDEAVSKFGKPAAAEVMRKNIIVKLENPVLPDASGLAISGKLQPGDEILEVEGKSVHVYTDMAYQVSRFGIKPISVLVERDGSEVLVENVIFPMYSEKSVLFAETDFRVYSKEETFGTVMHEAFFKSVATVKMTVSSVADTFTGRYGVEALSGPIGIGEQVGDMVESEFPIMNLLTLLVLVSLSLGICNLLPLPVLDGGRVLLFLIEAVRRKPLNPKVESAIMAISMVAVLLLMVFVAFKDIIGLF